LRLFSANPHRIPFREGPSTWIQNPNSRSPGRARLNQSQLLGYFAILIFYTYWMAQQIRVIAIAPDGVFAGQPQEFTSKLHQLIPMGRLANEGGYEGAILFLCSDPSSYMTGHNLIVDGGPSVL
jgi:hypothetical protein